MGQFSGYPEITSLGDSDYLIVDKVPITTNSTSRITKQNALSSVNLPATFTQNGIVKQTIYNVRDYGAVGNGVTDDTAAVQSAITAMGSISGILWYPSGNYKQNSSVILINGTRIQGEGDAVVTITSSTVGGDGHKGIFQVTNVNNIKISGISFNLSGTWVGVATKGGNDLEVFNNSFSGNTTAHGGVIFLDAEQAVTDIVNTKIHHNNISSIVGADPIKISATTHNIDETKIYYNKFSSIQTPNGSNGCIDLNGTGNFTVNNTSIMDNGFIDVSYTAIQWGLSGGHNVLNTTVHHNYYNQTQASPITGHQGFAYFYSSYNSKVTNNTIIGSWTPTNLINGPALAPGRQSTPSEGVIITDNYIQGFFNAWDADSMRNVEVANNTIIRCGEGLAPGYAIQEYVNIHDNTMYNTGGASTASGMPFGSVNFGGVKIKIHDNICIDDRPIPTPTGVTATVQSGGSLTASTTYYYVVTALDGIGETVASSEVSGLTTSSNKKIKIAWTQVSGAKTYNIYRSTTSGIYTTPSLISSAAISTLPISFTDSGSSLVTGAPPNSSTVDQVAMQFPVNVNGYNYSDYEFFNNKFYLPNSTFTDGLFHIASGSPTLPNVIYGNEMHDSVSHTREYVFAQGNATGSTTFTVAKAPIISVTLTGNITVTLTNGIFVGQILQLRLTQDGTGSRTVTWPGNFKKTGGTLILSTAAGAIDNISMRWDGTNWYEISRDLNLS